jgi:hypothetical protein
MASVALARVVACLTLVTAALIGLAPGPMAQAPLGVMTFNIRTSNIPDGDNAWPLRKDVAVSTIERVAPLVRSSI